MKKRVLAYLASFAALLPACALAQPATEAAKPVAVPISAEIFARIPFIQEPVLSPDGKLIAGFLGINGQQLICVFSPFDKSKLRAFSLPEDTQANWVRWVNDGNIIVGVGTLYPMERGRWYISRLVGINAATGKITKLLWDLNGQNTANVIWKATDGSPDILVAAQASIFGNDDGFWPSVYRVNAETGRRRLEVAGRAGVMRWAADAAGNVRTGLAYRNSGRNFRLLYRDGGEGPFRLIDQSDTRKQESMLNPVVFEPGSTHAMTVHDDNQGRSAVFETDLATREDLKQVFVMPEGRAEVGNVILSADLSTLLGVATTRPDGMVHWIDKDLADLQQKFDAALTDRRARIVSLNRDRKRMLVIVNGPHFPGSLYYYNVDHGVLQKIADMNDGLKAKDLLPVKLVNYRSRDGLEIEAMLTLPRDAAGRKLPFIMMPHGGPWAQDGLDYDYWVQFLASRGYAVLQPNFRGSTGYGTEFLRKAEGQMGLAMQDDLSDGVAWAVKQGIADPARVCIVGASYGGYAAMWGIAREPDLYRCAISIAGVSNLRAEYDDFGAYLLSGKFQDDWDRMAPDFGAVSPIKAVDRIKTPLLLIHGVRDVTVDVAQSTHMFGKMKAAGKKVEYLPLKVADHYFTREVDRLAVLNAMAAFLDKYNPADPVQAATH